MCLGIFYQDRDQKSDRKHCEHCRNYSVKIHRFISTVKSCDRAKHTAKMKDGVILVNTSRGGLIKTEDLISGIRDHKFFAVGLDVYEEETDFVFEDMSERILQSSITQRLLSFPNVVMTSHQGFFTKEALTNIAETTLENAKAFMDGNELKNEVLS